MAQVEQIVDAIIQDLQDRQGLAGAWNGIESDIQEEIRQEWMRTIQRHLYPPRQPVAHPTLDCIFPPTERFY